MWNEGAKTSPTVLVIEDDDSVRRIVGMCFADAGFTVREASTGGEALPVLDNEPPEAVVLDLGLPDRLGGAVLERLREAPRQDAPAWVVISALRQDEATLQYGPVSHFLAKPFDPWTLVDMLERLMAED